jgi:eukaryotic-like serine/threonine-protein kinase
MIGQLLDRRYLITHNLSSGGFGETYLAQDTRIPGQPACVVKQLKSASTNPAHMEKARQLFNREAEALAKLGDHDQIPRLLAYFTEGDEFYLVQEFVEGHTVEAELGQLWSEGQVIQLLEEVLTVLAFVHAQGVIHRDIKPANIIRRQRDGKLILIDFGAIKQVRVHPDGSGEFSAVAPGTRIGTIGYMPMEQARGKPRPGSDLYALGMIAIQALTGLHPTRFEDDSVTGEARWQHLVPISPGLIHILSQMTRYNVRQRYQTATEALQAVQQLAHGFDPTPAAGPIAPPELLHELTLEWIDAGLPHSRLIHPRQPTRHPGSVRIGRDPARCDIVLSDITVSGLHVELFFNADDQHFYVRNLRETNPPLVDGRSLPQGERVLNQDSVLQLGHVELRVTAIGVKQYPSGYVRGLGQPTPPPDVTPTSKAAIGSPNPVNLSPVPNPPPPVLPPYRQEPVAPPPYVAPDSPQNLPQNLLPYPNNAISNPVAAAVERSAAHKGNLARQVWLPWAIGTALATAIGAALYLPNNFLGSLIAGATIGGCTGVVQWLVLRRWVDAIGGWILATIIATALSFAVAAPLPIVFMAVGVLPGLAQWLVLRHKLPQAGWWVLAKALSDLIGLTIGLRLAPNAFLLLGGIAGLISGVITGGVMVWLIRRSGA